MIGLFKAVRDYQPDKDSSFFHFADLCIARQMYTAVEASNRKKHAPLNSYVPLYADSEDSEGRNLADVLETIDEANPENLFISQEDREDFKRKVNETLSKMEQEVLSYYLQGFRYEQIAEAMGKEPKAVDNALQRLKKKLKGSNSMKNIIHIFRKDVRGLCRNFSHWSLQLDCVLFHLCMHGLIFIPTRILMPTPEISILQWPLKMKE